ncbi:hypothetical protein FA13DRAFT_1728090 [Coprinellus micaceus]|uniref:Fe2OG dioxygenase domain-containing protein n=1 Tax=Coprinellus micaceus TaxID=71717 RepID=A0A4Y7TM75_COPMI|nr:hypothetical protein FA13DRAFT_1728090 [Coprinellus micaceus]
MSSPNSDAPDHTILLNAFPDPDALFQALLTEVSWETMMHRGGPVPRLIAVQGTVSPTGTFPLYRHPADSLPLVLPFTPTVSAILEVVKDRVPVPEGGEINHVLIQHYRGGADYISEHSDKTLDILRGSTIVNVSLGAERTMTLRPKKEWVHAATGGSDGEPRNAPAVERIPLPHGSLFLLGPMSNKLYQHGIKHDNRPFDFKSPLQQAFDGERISLTFRCISTFLQPSPSHGPDRFLIYGQGARVKDPESAQLVPLPLAQITNEEKAWAQKEAGSLLRSFGEENFRAQSFNWGECYGEGFDVVHLS